MSLYQNLVSNLRKLIGDIGRREGHMLPNEKSVDIVNDILSNTENPKKICEIGFNAGHSATSWLTVSDDIYLHSVDNGMHHYTKNQMRKVKSFFGDRFDYTVKDSKDLKSDFYEGYDLVIIDGGHDWQTIQHDYRMIRDANVPYILIDDYLMIDADSKISHRHLKEVTRLVNAVINSSQPYERVARFDMPVDPIWSDQHNHLADCRTVQILLKRKKV
jgi:hypothetical protein